MEPVGANLGLTLLVNPGALAQALETGYSVSAGDLASSDSVFGVLARALEGDEAEPLFKLREAIREKDFQKAGASLQKLASGLHALPPERKTSVTSTARQLLARDAFRFQPIEKVLSELRGILLNAPLEQRGAVVLGLATLLEGDVDIQKLVEESLGNIRAAEQLKMLSSLRPDLFRSEYLPKIIEVGRLVEDVALAVNNLVFSSPVLFTTEHLSQMIHAAGVQPILAPAILHLAYYRPEIFIPRHIDSMIRDLVVRSLAYAINHLAWLRANLFDNTHIRGLLRINLGSDHRSQNQINEALGSLAEKRPEIFTSDDVTTVLEKEEGEGGTLSSLYAVHTLMQEAPQIFTSEHITRIIGLLRRRSEPSAYPLTPLARNHPEIFEPPHIELIRSLADAERVLEILFLKRVDLFPGWWNGLKRRFRGREKKAA